MTADRTKAEAKQLGSAPGLCFLAAGASAVFLAPATFANTSGCLDEIVPLRFNVVICFFASGRREIQFSGGTRHGNGSGLRGEWQSCRQRQVAGADGSACMFDWMTLGPHLICASLQQVLSQPHPCSMVFLADSRWQLPAPCPLPYGPA